MCIDAGDQQHDISVGIDDGTWYSAKLANSKRSQPRNTADIPLLPYSGWKKFPTVPEIPTHFNTGHVHHHIVESVQYMDAVCTNSDSEEEIEDVHTSKPLKRGIMYVESGHVEKIQDSAKSGHYFMKTKVMVSYRRNVSYDVTVTLSQLSGFVRDASCMCVASAIGKRSHVTGLLYALLGCLKLKESNKPESCTSHPCAWNQRRKRNKDPQ